jgi:predicted hotdog family 3-hydroxylacyl-ACP dehydratase
MNAAAWPAGAAIAALIPHQGRMCLLDAVLDCTAERITCRASSHTATDHPLRSPQGLLAPVGIEYAAQAMALHGALNAKPGVDGRPGFLASARGVRLYVDRLDTVQGALLVQVDHLAGDERQAMYRFALHDEQGRPLLDGRATVVLDTPLAAVPPSPSPASGLPR